jgi:hypothetical protein
MKTKISPLLRRVFSTATTLLLISFQSQAQHIFIERNESRLEAGFNFGPTFFLGDLGGNRGIGTKFIKDINLDMTRMMKSAYISYYPSEAIGFRLAGTITSVAGSDDQITTETGAEIARKMRNLDFRSSIWEVYTAVEFFPGMWINKLRRKETYSRIQPYCFAGIGVFHFNPEGSLTENGKKKWHNLKELMTEGQGMEEYAERNPYKLTQLNIPLGFGIRYSVNDGINTSLECNYRQTFTDYIDDVSTNYIDPNLFEKYLSPEKAEIARAINNKALGANSGANSRYGDGTQRGNPKNTDAYFSFSFKLGVNLSTIFNPEYGSRQYSKRQLRCPNKTSLF